LTSAVVVLLSRPESEFMSDLLFKGRQVWRKYMKKLIAFVLLGVMLVGFGCTPKKTGDTTQGGTTAGQTGQTSEESATTE
jgi:hypothetical protein